MKVRSSNLFVVVSVLSELLGRDETVSEEESTEVVDLGAIDQSLDGRGLEVSGLEVLSSSESGAEGSVNVASEYSMLRWSGWVD